MDLLKAIQTVIDYLDSKMVDAPNRELADFSNALEDLKKEVQNGG